jgi:tetratricopeptide (TPR) repeat protein
MKKIFSIFVAALMSATMLAVETQYLPISVYAADDSESFPQGAKAMVENKLTQLLTRNGIAGLDYMGQFILTVTTTPLDKDVIPGPPAKIAEKMEMNLYIVDAYAKTIFSSTSLTVKGLGETENKCYLNAISHMPLQSPQMTKFIEEGKAKIIEYYDHEGEALLKRAAYLASQKNYEEALFIVSLIPQQSKHYDAALAAGLDIYQQHIDNQCNINLAAARVAWAAEQNTRGAYAAGEYLANILPDAKCYGEAMELYKEIKGKVLDDWKFEMKKYQDGVDIEKLRIDAARQVGVAYGTHQPAQTTSIEFLRTLL